MGDSRLAIVAVAALICSACAGSAPRGDQPTRRAIVDPPSKSPIDMPVEVSEAEALITIGQTEGWKRPRRVDKTEVVTLPPGQIEFNVFLLGSDAPSCTVTLDERAKTVWVRPVVRRVGRKSVCDWSVDNSVLARRRLSELVR